MLKSLVPSKRLFAVASAMFKDVWDVRCAALKAGVVTLKRDIAALERKIEQFLDRAIDADTPALIKAYEGRVSALELQKAALLEQVEKSDQPLHSFDKSYRTAMEFLSNPWKLWDSNQLAYRRAVLKLAFSDKLAYVRNEGYRTANIAFPFKALTTLNTQKTNGAPKRRKFEHFLRHSGRVGAPSQSR